MGKDDKDLALPLKYKQAGFFVIIGLMLVLLTIMTVKEVDIPFGGVILLMFVIFYGYSAFFEKELDEADQDDVESFCKELNRHLKKQKDDTKVDRGMIYMTLQEADLKLVDGD